MESTDKTVDDRILCTTFNQDSSCFAVGTERGFRIYNTYPFKDNFERILDGGIGIIEMLNRCNIIALVGGGKNPKYDSNKVIIWDDHQQKMISELRFSSYVKNVKLKKDKIIVVCEQKIFVFNLISFQNIDVMDTYDNPQGIVAVSVDSKITVLAYPDKTKGYVRVKSYNKQFTSLINAHESAISYIALSYEGNLLATSSVKGTLIRVFKADDGTLLQQLRRGLNQATIYTICFDVNSNFLSNCSDKGTVHIWSLANAHKKLKEIEEELERKKEGSAPQNRHSFFRKFFGSDGSFAQFRLSDPKSICTFGPNNTIIAISSIGKYYQASFNNKKGDCTLLKEFSLYINEKDEEDH